MEEIKSFLSFHIGSELFAANVGQVRNIIEQKKITKVPDMPDYMLGVINQRGEVLPVIDARIKFGMTPTQFTVDTCILDVEVQAEEGITNVGLVVDSVSEVLQIEQEEIKASPGITTSSSNDFFSGIYHHNDNFILIIDVNKVIKNEEVIDLAGISEIAEVKAEAESEAATKPKAEVQPEA